MKLYATTTSERAEKGQGGNEYLQIKVLDDNKKSVILLSIKPKNDSIGELIDVRISWAEHIYINGHHGLDAEITTKGKKQKGKICRFCKKKGIMIQDNEGDFYCPNPDCEMYQ